MIKATKKGQVWTTDFIIGLMLFIVVSMFTVKVAFSMYPSQTHIIVYRDAVHLSSTLLSPGYPSDWNSSDVLMPGVAKNNRIDQNKLNTYGSLEYAKAKTLLHVTSDYIFFIQNNTNIINTGQCVYGFNISTSPDCTPNLSVLHYENLARMDRMIIYNSTVMIMTVYTWN